MKIVTPKELQQDYKWNSVMERMCSKYGISSHDVYQVIYGETVPKWNFESFNKSTKASGAFQFIPSAINFVNKRKGYSYTYSDVLKMEPYEQLQLYEAYLDSWNYQGDIALGFMQAAPGKYWKMKKRGGRLNPSDIVYEKDSKAWRMNPAWRDENGKITVQSIRDYYGAK
jgi:hypothetical protein